MQVLSPIFLAVNQMDFLKTLGNGHASNLGIWPSVSVFVVIILFITINQEIFSKQVHNSLLVYRMRNVAWNSSRTWQVCARVKVQPAHPSIH